MVSFTHYKDYIYSTDAYLEPESPSPSSLPDEDMKPVISSPSAIQSVALWILSASLVQLLLVIVVTLPPRANEPWLLRWLRTAGEHPVRSTLALGLGLHALVLPRPLGRP